MIVRLWERMEGEAVVRSVLERSTAELERVAFVGKSAPGGPGAVYDIEVSKPPLHKEAERVLLLSQRDDVEATDDRAGAVARARKAVTLVTLPPPPARIKRGATVEGRPTVTLDAEDYEDLLNLAKHGEPSARRDVPAHLPAPPPFSPRKKG